MSAEREDLLSVARILEQTDLSGKMIELMKKAIAINPELNEDERELLSAGYKNRISHPRKAIRSMESIISQEVENLKNKVPEVTEERVSQLNEVKSELMKELKSICEDCIELVDKTLLPVANSVEAKIFYEKMEADYYRYFCEFIEDGEERNAVAAKSKDCYDAAIKIATDEIPHFKPAYLGLLLNYSVFLFEILGEKEEAIKLSKETYENSKGIVEQNSEKSLADATMILTILQENVDNWSK